MQIKLIPVILGVVIVGLLAVLIFVPAPQKTNAPTAGPATSTPADSANPAATSNSTASASTTARGPDSEGMWSYTSRLGKTVRVSIAPGTKLYDGMRITGNVPAGWPFEAVFGINVVDGTGKNIGGGRPTVPNWMSPTGAWFSAYLAVHAESIKTGYLVLQNDNPSDMRQYDDSVRIPVVF